MLKGMLMPRSGRWDSPHSQSSLYVAFASTAKAYIDAALAITALAYISFLLGEELENPETETIGSVSWFLLHFPASV